MLKKTLSLIISCAAALGSAQTYHVTDLGTLGSFQLNQDAWALGINNSGGITGISGAPDGTIHPFYWANGAMNDLGFPNGTSYAINDSGAMVIIQNGTAWVGTPGNFLAIPDAGGQAPYGINSLGQVVGGYSYAYLYTPGSILGFDGGPTLMLPSLGYAAEALGVNDSGNVVGFAALGPPYPNHAVLWTNGVAQDLGTLGGTQSIAEAINNSNQIAGYATFAGDAFWHACVWSNGALADLGTLGGPSSVAQGINSIGQVVGYSDITGTSSIFPFPGPTALQGGAEQGHAFLFSNGAMTDLNNVVDSSGAPFVLESANGINDHGQIIAMGFDPSDAQEHALLLTPVNVTPVTTISLSGASGTNGWFVSTVTATLSASDPSGIQATYFTLDGGPTQVYAGPIAISGDGVHTLAYWSVDSLGNIENTHTAAIDEDKTIPAISMSSPSASTYLLGQPVTVAYTANDATSGLASLVATAPSGSSLPTNSVGNGMFTVTATDVAGNVATSSVNYRVAYGVKLISVECADDLIVLAELVDAHGNNVSSASISVAATGTTVVSGGPAGTLDQTSFNYIDLPFVGGFYILDSHLVHFHRGSYLLNFIAGSDPTTHTAPFTVAR
ncbi:MAG: hypothetical protein P4L46_02745 [Fimbriimonas sp.]|nr:hypothetical protein [Fimbriimonas sp.]